MNVPTATTGPSTVDATTSTTAADISRKPATGLHPPDSAEARIPSPDKTPSAGTLRAIEAKQQGHRNMRIDKRDFPDAHGKETTKIIAQSGAIYELIGTLDDDHSQQLEKRQNFKATGEFRFPGFDGIVRMARAVDDLGNPGEFAIVKKFISRRLAEKEFNNIMGAGKDPQFVEVLDIAYSIDKDGLERYYVFIKLVPGADLSTDLGRISKDLKSDASREATEHEVRTDSKGMLQALVKLHDQGKEHRDVKLRNFIKSRDGTIVACDFAKTSTEAERNPFRRDPFKAGVCLLCFAEGKEVDNPTIRIPNRQGTLVTTTPTQLFNERHNFDIDSLPGNTIEEVAAKLIVGMKPKEALQLPYFAQG